jgi:hypothetical protein
MWLLNFFKTGPDRSIIADAAVVDRICGRRLSEANRAGTRAWV